MNIILFVVICGFLLSVEAGQSSEPKCLDGAPALLSCKNQQMCDSFGLTCTNTGTGRYCCALSSLKSKIYNPLKKADDPKKDDPCKPETKPDTPTKPETKPDEKPWDPINNPSCKDQLQECPNKLRLCLMLEYERLMRKHCMRTCNFCNELAHATGKVSRLLASTHTKHFECYDIKDDCKENAFLCNQFGPYRGAFIRNCLRTCDIC